MSGTKFPARLVLLGALGLSALLAAWPASGDTAAAASAAPASSSSEAAVSAPLIRPLWQAATNGSGLYSDFMPEINGMVYYADNQRLVAAELRTGKIRWSVREGGRPEAMTANSLFYLSRTREVVKVDARTGKRIWSVKPPLRPSDAGSYLQLVNGTLLFSNEGMGLAAFNPVTGALLWSNSQLDLYAGGPFGQFGKILMVSGTIDNVSRHWFGLNAARGTELWSLKGPYDILGSYKGGLLLRENTSLAIQQSKKAVPGNLVSLYRLNPLNGGLAPVGRYIPVSDLRRMANYSNTLEGSSLYSVDGDLDQGDAILRRYDLDSAGQASPVSYEQYGTWVAGPAQGLALFSGGNSLIGLRLADGSRIDYGRFPAAFTRVQIIDSLVVAGLADGSVYVMNAGTGQAIGRIQTGDAEFGNVAVREGVLLIPTEKKLLAVKVGSR
ncbi:PQQ-like beta-propeller repeat protein [Paenibacillus spiritus]|uniref:PQQ-like beta-propeller repeat protein n=1 Tax=Paenibacillus spiritus TaxID=2496557 RepID=A0A5J5GFN6_9BACL|nr:MULTISPECIES: PQQ-binding-like beta-propeller repeat protein [Paenibacillus]KAA9006572.1 PQQ-like beta-propeller repeat protein [Paenibacillus spiritus]